MEMSVEWVPILANHCRARSVDFLCTPFDEAWVDALDPYVPAFKVASYELSHLPLLRTVLERGKPAFISTGASALPDVLRVVELAREVGNTQIVFLQCTAAYPTPPTDVNARAIGGDVHGSGRRSVFSVRAIGAGEVLTEDNIRVLRNGANAPGLAPEEYPRLLGKRAARNIMAGTGITDAMVGNEPRVA